MSLRDEIKEFKSMKRLLILVLALTLCFAGCKEEPKMPDTPEVKHTEEVKAPIEETPEEPDGIEPTEEPDENVIILPEPDENTKVITIEFPEDFPEEPYTEPELVSPEEFKWGEYVPFVNYVSGTFTNAHNEIYSFAILNESTKTLIDGTNLYNLLNKKYLVENKIEGGIFNGYHFSSEERAYVYDALKNSHIIYISENADEYARFYLTESSGQKAETDKLDLLYDTHFDYIKNGEVVFSKEEKETSLFETSISLGSYLFFNEYSYPESGVKYKLPMGSKGDILYQNKDFLLFTDFSVPSFYRSGEVPNTINWNVYSSTEKSVARQINLPSIRYKVENETYSLWGEISQVISEDYYIIEFFKGVGEYGYYGFSFATYLFDAVNNKLTLLETYAVNPLLSPDLKYLAYHDNNDGDIIDILNNLENQKDGIYIKNLENGETVFFEHNHFCYALSWVKEQSFYESIKA